MKQTIFDHTSAFILFSPVHTNTFLKRQKALMEATVYDAFLELAPFSKTSVFTETERFQKAPLLKPFLKASVFISVFGRFSTDDRRERIKKYVFFHTETD